MTAWHTVLVALLLPFPTVARASISGNNQISIDFTNPTDASAKASWSRPERVRVSTGGLGWDGPSTASLDGWIELEPLAIGYSWRPPSGVTVRVAIRPVLSEIVLENGQRYIPDPGAVFVRYSPDLEHWSSWQVLQKSQARSIDEKKNPGIFFEGEILVPTRDRERYYALLNQYSRLNVPWGSDEEAVVEWILKGEPDFFSKQIPLIGYVQLLYENRFAGGRKISNLEAEIDWGIGGMTQPAKDPTVEKNRDVPWRFRSKH